MCLDRHDTRARLLSFEGRQAKTAPAAFPQLYIAIAWKKQSLLDLRFAALLVVRAAQRCFDSRVRDRAFRGQ